MSDETNEVRTTRQNDGQTVVEKQEVSHSSKDQGLLKIVNIVYLVYGVIAGLLGIRFLLSLLGANPSNAFADFIYSITSPFVAPFRGLFNINNTYGVSRFDIESVVAVLVFGLVAWAIAKAFSVSMKEL